VATNLNLNRKGAPGSNLYVRQFTMRTLSYLLLVIGLISLSGCITETIARSGKSFDHLQDPKIKVDQVRKELGNPVFSRKYSPAKRIRETEECRHGNREYFDFSPVKSARNGGSDDSSKDGFNRYTSLCEVYHPHGWFSEGDTQYYGMISAMTLGIGDLVMIPSALSYKRNAMRKGRCLTMFYDANGHYVATYYGDISDRKKQQE